MNELSEITLGVGTLGEGEDEAALGVSDARGALDEAVAQRADTLERPEAGPSGGVFRSARGSTHLKLAPEGASPAGRCCSSRGHEDAATR